MDFEWSMGGSVERSQKSSRKGEFDKHMINRWTQTSKLEALGTQKCSKDLRLSFLNSLFLNDWGAGRNNNKKKKKKRITRCLKLN